MHGTHSANWATRAPRPSIFCHKLRYSLNVPPHSWSSSLWALYSVFKGVVFTIHSFGLPFSPNPSSSSFWGTPRYPLALWDKQYLQCFLHLSLLQVKISVYLHRDVCRNWSSVNVKKQAPQFWPQVSVDQLVTSFAFRLSSFFTPTVCWRNCITAFEIIHLGQTCSFICKKQKCSAGITKLDTPWVSLGILSMKNWIAAALATHIYAVPCGTGALTFSKYTKHR